MGSNVYSSQAPDRSLVTHICKMHLFSNELAELRDFKRFTAGRDTAQSGQAGLTLRLLKNVEVLRTQEGGRQRLSSTRCRLASELSITIWRHDLTCAFQYIAYVAFNRSSVGSPGGAWLSVF